MVWRVLAFLDQVTETKSRNLKAIVTEKLQIPSQMPFSYAASLPAGCGAASERLPCQARAGTR